MRSAKLPWASGCCPMIRIAGPPSTNRMEIDVTRDARSGTDRCSLSPWPTTSANELVPQNDVAVLVVQGLAGWVVPADVGVIHEVNV